MTDDKRSNLLDKIRALLAKAESTNFPEEAKAYQGKAQELMTRYAIEEMEISDARSVEADKIVHEYILIHGPFALSKGLILQAVAKANRCRVLFPNRLNKGYRVTYDTWSGQAVRTETPLRPKGSGNFHLIGYSSDVELVKMMFTSLLVQATGEMLDSDLDRIQAGIHGKTWRNSFLQGYAGGLTSRLYVANERAKADYAPSMSLALIDKDKEVDKVCNDMSSGKKAMTGAQSFTAYGKGQAAANRADVGNSRIGNNNRALS